MYAVLLIWLLLIFVDDVEIPFFFSNIDWLDQTFQRKKNASHTYMLIFYPNKHRSKQACEKKVIKGWRKKNKQTKAPRLKLKWKDE